MLAIELGRRKGQLATSWNELTGRQLLQVAQLHGRQFPTRLQERRAYLRILLQQPWYLFNRLNAVQRVELSRYTRFLREPTDHAPLTAQLLPRLPRLRWWALLLSDYYGPRDNFRNLRFHEFIFADTYFLRYLQTNEEAQLDNLVAVLYRPQRARYAPLAVDYQGDRREDFSEHLVERRARLFQHLPHYVKWAVLLWYRGCRQQLERSFPHVFTDDNTQTAAKSGWTDVLHELAGSVHYLDATAAQPLKSVLREMNRLLRLAEERQAAAGN